MPQPRIQVEGIPELRALLKQVGGKELEKELGQVHKRIGQMVIDRLGGKNTGVGAGAGSSIRPSAAAREVLLRVGGTHRARWGRVGRWGKRWDGVERGRRPHLIGAATEMQDQIEDAYMRGVDQLIRKVGFDQ